MLQGSHFLLLVHLSCVKSQLLELFYHIVREVQGSLINQATTRVWRKGRKSLQEEEIPMEILGRTVVAIFSYIPILFLERYLQELLPNRLIHF